VKLHDLSISSLVQHIDSPTLAGISPRRRHYCLHRSPLIQHVFVQLVAPTPSPRLTEARVQVFCRRRLPEHCRRR
jgi:hypothetical protein